MGSSNVKRPARASRGESLTHGGGRGAVARSLWKTVGSFLKNKKTRHTPTMERRKPRPRRTCSRGVRRRVPRDRPT